MTTQHYSVRSVRLGRTVLEGLLQNAVIVWLTNSSLTGDKGPAQIVWRAIIQTLVVPSVQNAQLTPLLVDLHVKAI